MRSCEQLRDPARIWPGGETVQVTRAIGAPRAAGAVRRATRVQVAAWGVALALAGGAAAQAATLMKVRIGNHPDKTRVVLETDGVAGHRITEQRADEIVVRLDADSVPEAIAGNGQPLLWVRVEPRIDGTDIRFQLVSSVRVEEMVLEGPDRIVLDLVPADATVGVAPAPQPAAPSFEPEPEPVRALADPGELAETEPVPDEPVAQPTPGAGPESQAEPQLRAEPEARTEPEVRQVEVVDRAPKRQPAPPPPSRSGGPLAILGNPVVLGALGLVISVLAVWAVRRRSQATEAFDEDVGPDPADETTGSIGAAFAQADADSSSADETSDGASIFDVDEAEVIAEDTASDSDYPADGATTLEVAAPAASLETNELGEDMAAIVQELERRMAHFETRLEEVVDAKERLERQVSAQTEELRVQRAAIARTQRVLRGIARSEEEGDLTSE